MKEKKIDPALGAILLPMLSAEEVHKNIMRLHRLRRRVDRKILGWLHVLITQEHYKALHCSRPARYVMDKLDYETTEAHEIVKVAEKLESLPLSLDAYESGRLSLAKLKQIAKVVTKEKESVWLAFALKHRQKALEAEVKAALDDGRDEPREDSAGLPNVRQKFSVSLPLEAHEILRQALEKAAWEILEASKGQERPAPTLEEVLVHLAKRFLELPLPGSSGDESARKRCAFNITYIAYPPTKDGYIMTPDGPVAVPWEHLMRIEGEARKLELTLNDLVQGEALPPGEVDKVIPAGVEAKVVLLKGDHCARCGRKLCIHIDHVAFRSKQGPNEVWNLLCLCKACHGLVHRSILDVFRDSLGHLYWRSRADRIDAILEEEMKELAAVPSVVIALPPRPPASPFPATGSSGATAAAGESTLQAAGGREGGGGGGDGGTSGGPGGKDGEPGGGAVAGGGSPGGRSQAPGSAPPPAATIEEESEDAAEALETLGYRKAEARERVVRALAYLATLGRRPTGDEIVRAAIGGRKACKSLRPAASPGEKFRSAENLGRGDGRAPGSGHADGGEPVAG